MARVVHDDSDLHRIVDDDAIWALSQKSAADAALAEKFAAQGGPALCLSSAFCVPDALRAEACHILECAVERHAQPGTEVPPPPLRMPGWEHVEADLAQEAGPLERAALLLQAAQLAEEQEALSRSTWADIDFQCGDERNAELLACLERQFSSQLANTPRATGLPEAPGGPTVVALTFDAISSTSPSVSRQSASVADLVDDGWSVVMSSERTMSCVADRELATALAKSRNLGVALDLVGAYLKNYEIHKADQVLSRVLPICRALGGPWYVKAVDKLCAVRMKQHRPQDALLFMKELEAQVPFNPSEAWELFEVLYRNFAWVYAALGDAVQCLAYTSKAVDVKQLNGIPASWFDCWDLSKAHARFGQMSDSTEEMQAAYELCLQAASMQRQAEPNDAIMLAKILSNVGEIAMGIGDSYSAAKEHASANSWYCTAEKPVRESYDIYCRSIGPLKPLSGWQAGIVAHCLVRLERWPEAQPYLALALKVECCKDVTTAGSLCALVHRVFDLHQMNQNMDNCAVYEQDLMIGLASLREGQSHVMDSVQFANLLNKIASLLLSADHHFIPKALDLLSEAEIVLVGGIRQLSSIPIEGASADLTTKFSHDPKIDVETLLKQIRENRRVLDIGHQAMLAVDLGEQ